MPIVGHGLVGLGIGAAGSADPRSPVLRRTWLGTIVLLAFLPDLLEWAGKLAGGSLPHSVFESFVVCGLIWLSVMFLFRRVFRETNRLALLAATAAIWSHPLLDLVAGGVPLWWPFSSRLVGGDWLGWNEPSRADRLIHETMVFLPVAAGGLTVAIWRTQRHRRSTWAAILLLVAAIDGMLLGSEIVTLLGCAGLLTVAWWIRPFRPGPTLLAQVLPCFPVVLLGAVELYAWDQMRQGVALETGGDPAAALPYYQRTRRFMPVDLESAALFRTGICHMRLGREATAYRTFRRGLEREPDSPRFRYGLAILFLGAKDPYWYRPDEAIRLAEELVEHADSVAYVHRVARPLLERARQAARDRPNAAAG